VSKILSVNLGAPEPSLAESGMLTGINKRPVAGAVHVRAPGPRTAGLHSGVVGDHIGDVQVHGGDDQAVYAYAREDYDWWEARLGRALAGGAFGENLTTAGIDVTGAVIGERWRIGGDLELQVTLPRIPCNTFAAKMAIPQWIKTFTQQARPGAYLRVVAEGDASAGDEVTVTHRPAHGLTIGEVFRALTLEPELLPKLLEAGELPEEPKAKARKRLGL
jgi:MOSC domain-containing protein YiiM